MPIGRLAQWMASTGTLRTLGIVSVALLSSRSAHADPPDAPNDFGILLADPTVDPPPVLAHNARQANATFDRRATRFLRFAACRAEPASPMPGDFQGALNSDFSTNLEAWGLDALAKLAYTGECGSDAAPGTQTAAGRFAAVDGVLAGLTIAPGLVEGTSVSQVTSGIDLERRGDLDTGLKELIPVLYLYGARIPRSFQHVLGLVAAAAGGPAPLTGVPPYIAFQINPLTGVATAAGQPPPPISAAAGVSLFVPETENHTLLELSNQYLINQLVNRTASATLVDNSFVHDAVLAVLTGIVSTDFFEYGSKPYQHFALYAVENLADFAGDADVQGAAHAVLDYAAAKFASSSSLLRRAAPYRRRGSKDGNFLMGTQADEQLCRYYLYSGELEAAVTVEDGHRVFAAHSFCASAVREAVGSYRVPDVILDMAFTPNLPYVQTFSGGSSYYAGLYAPIPGTTPVRGTTEIYDNELTFLIAGGGLPQPNGLPLVLTGIDADLGPGIVSTFVPAIQSTIGFAVDDEDVGISLPILLVPDDRRDRSQPDDAPIVDRRELVRIEGTGHHGANLCVAPGFACGKNPTMPGAATAACSADNPWQFADLDSSPVHTYVAMLCAPAYVVSLTAPSVAPGEQPMLAPYTIGLFEAAPASRFHGFDDFQRKVRSNNPLGAGLLVEHNGTPTPQQLAAFSFPQPPCPTSPGAAQSCYVVTGWSGRYTKTDGTRFDFEIPVEEAALDFANPSPFGDYPVTSPDIALPPTDPATWDLADGPVQATRTGTFRVTDPRDDRTCTVSITDPAHPVRTGCEVSCQRCSDGFPCSRDRDCGSRVCHDGACRAPACSPACGAGASCGSDMDCASQRCEAGRCRGG
jgi:hypothetical protein